MEIRRKLSTDIKLNADYFFLAAVFLVSMVVYGAAGLFQHEFSKVMDVAGYLAWHNIFEFISIFVSFSVFTVSYYTYNQTGRFGSIFLGYTFLFSGLIDTFHTLSFKGMPDFFVPNDEANRATTFWIISRLAVALGFFIKALMPKDIRPGINRRLFALLTVLAGILVFSVVTYYPDVLPVMFDENTGLTDMKKVLEIAVIIMFALAAVKFVHEYAQTGDKLVVMLAASLLLGIFCELAFMSYKNDVHHIYNYLGHIYKFISSFIIFRVIFIYNVQQPYIDLSQAKNEIKEYAENLDKLVEKRTHELRLMNQKLLDDLEYARDIQKAILPSLLPKEKGVGFSARYFPAERVSGDFYNIFKLDDDNVGMYIGDVAGHGVPAAMLMVFLNQSIKTARETGNSSSQWEIAKPSAVLKALYKSFNDAAFRDEIYMVLLYAIFNIKEKSLTFSSAGINVPPLVIDSERGVRELEVKGFPICKFIEFHEADYTDEVFQLKEGDKILFYTDGLTDAENKNRENYADSRLLSLLSRQSKLACSELADIIEDDVFEYMGDTPLKDDITFFIMEVK